MLLDNVGPHTKRLAVIHCADLAAADNALATRNSVLRWQNSE